MDPLVFKEELARASKEPQQREKGDCTSSFDAVERANSRLNRGFSVTGVVAAIDSRHGMVLPNSVADLQKGEKYVHQTYLLDVYMLIEKRYFNSDFVFLSVC